MDEPFEIPLTYKGKEYSIDAQLRQVGYIHRFIVVVEGVELWIERDEEGAFRAIVPPETPEKEAGKLDKGMVEAIIETIEKLLL
jgi:hypothetical protein